MRFVSTLLVLTTLLTVGASKEAAIDPVTRLMERLLPNHAGSNLIEFRGRHRDGGCAEHRPEEDGHALGGGAR